jgi:glycosyltransferase involved in cell wall biosynthesis
VLLANSEAAKIVLTQCIKLPADRIRIVYNGVPRPERSLGSASRLRDRLGIGTDVPLVVAVSRMDTPKGHVFLLRAIPYVWQSVPETHFALIGDGPLRGYLETEAQRLGLLGIGSLHFTGFLLNAPGLIQEADLLVHPAVREPLGNVLIEAGLARLPVVASNVDGCPEVVMDGRTGVLVDCTQPVEYVAASGASSLPAVVVDGRTRTLRPPLGPSPEDLAEAMISLLLNPQLRRVMGERARERAERLFDLGRYVRDLESVYRAEG